MIPSSINSFNDLNAFLTGNQPLLTLFIFCRKLHIPEEKIKNELETQGYSVVPGLIPLEKCDEYTLEFRAWLDRFEEDSPVRRRSILHQYRTSHSNAAWRLRLHAKPVYESIWGTEKLLTSVDGMSIAEPPEQGKRLLLTYFCGF